MSIDPQRIYNDSAKKCVFSKYADFVQIQEHESVLYKEEEEGDQRNPTPNCNSNETRITSWTLKKPYIL